MSTFFYERLLASLREALAFAEGEADPGDYGIHVPATPPADVEPVLDEDAQPIL